jgi:hypothetical protein
VEALLEAYRSTAGAAAFLPPAEHWDNLLFAFGLQRALDDLQRFGDAAGGPSLVRRLRSVSSRRRAGEDTAGASPTAPRSPS